MRVLITGGAGFIGQHLARSLVDVGHEVTALDSLLGQVHSDPRESISRFPGEVVVADVADQGSWDLAPAADAIVHLAAETGTSQSMYEQERYTRVNVDGTRYAAELASATGAALVSLSSRAVYGEGAYECDCHGRQFTMPPCPESLPSASLESDEHAPVSVYGATKSQAEQAARSALASGSLSIVRPQNVIGPGQALHNPYTGVLAAFLAMLREQRPLTIYGDGHQTRDLVHVSDLVALLHWLVENPADIGLPRVLNCGSGTRTTLTELAAAARAASPLGDPGTTHVDVHRAGDIEHACADLSACVSVGGPLPRWSTAAAVADFITWAWDRPGAPSSAWDGALSELSSRGLSS